MNLYKFSKLVIILCVIFAAENYTAEFQEYSDSSATVDIYVIKNYWHTGIILPLTDSTISHCNVLNQFGKEEFVDIGFGDRVFYLDPDYDIALAARAILVPTESTIRIAAIAGKIEDVIRRSDYALKIKLRFTELLKLCDYIDSSLTKDTTNNVVLIEDRANGQIKYFDGEQKYHLFNTCNTWVSKALEFCGLDYLKPSEVVTSRDLFTQLALSAEILKEDKSDSIF